MNLCWIFPAFASTGIDITTTTSIMASDFQPMRFIGEEGSRVITVNGAAAHQANPGDLVIAVPTECEEAERRRFYQPALVYVDPR
jgi:aspartate 1-decarboxylase